MSLVFDCAVLVCTLMNRDGFVFWTESKKYFYIQIYIFYAKLHNVCHFYGYFNF